MGYGVTLIVLPNHLGMGVLGGENIHGSYYEYNGGRYFYRVFTSKPINIRNARLNPADNINSLKGTGFIHLGCGVPPKTGLRANQIHARMLTNHVLDS